jgi:hypothetical protein
MTKKNATARPVKLDRRERKRYAFMRSIVIL